MIRIAVDGVPQTIMAMSGRSLSGQPKLADRIHTLLLVTFGYIFTILLGHYETQLARSFLEFAIPSDSGPIFPINFTVLMGLSGMIVVGALALDTYQLKFKQYPAAMGHRIHRRLDYDDVFDNPNRQKIITTILNNPGIHYNKLRSVCDLQPGQLQWHLNILKEYSIIHQQKMGRYQVFYATRDESSQHLQKVDHPISKSPTAMKILSTIRTTPGITSSEIAHLMVMKRNSIKYHVDKLKGYNFIRVERCGRKIHLYCLDYSAVPDLTPS
ncbi:MAG: winged helix-turn-helix transcriptional regulator [Promethearchaeota archaeon]